MTNKMPDNKDILIRKGTILINPESIDIGNEIDPDRIAGDGVVIYPGSKIYGERTLILPGATIGYEAPATIENCCIGSNVKLGGGYFKDSVFLKNVTFGSCTHVREGCILEEESGAAHSVGLKQTILFPYVTLGSLINFCDCFMAGGTGKKNHSEVGSSYIHFNFTPQQDKATPSLFGDVPRGVMLDQPPIFLGGQGGLVGPCRIEFGVTIAAGTICRTDELRPNRLIFGSLGKGGNISYTPGIYRNVKRILMNNLIYIGNIYALHQWYAWVRRMFISDTFPDAILNGLCDALDLAIAERIKRFKEFIGKLRDMNKSDLQEPDKNLFNQWPAIEEKIRTWRHFTGDAALKDSFLGFVESGIRKSGKEYLDVVKELDPDSKKTGSRWLQGIVDRFVNDSISAIPSLTDAIK